MKSIDELPERLLEQIYDAASDGTLWPSVMKGVADLCGGQGGLLLGLPTPLSKVTFAHNGGFDETYVRIANERHLSNPWSRVMISQPIGCLRISDQIVSLKDLRSTTFYNELLRPQGIGHNAMAALGTPSHVIAFNIMREERRGPFEREQLERIERLLPHVQRSLLLWRRFEAYDALKQLNEKILGRLTSGVVLLEHSGLLVYANPAAAAFTERSGPFKLVNERLTLRLDAQQREFEAALGAIAGGAPAKTIRIWRSFQKQPLNLLLIRARCADSDRFAALGAHSPDVIGFINDPSRAPSVSFHVLTDLYGLTAAEARVMLAAAKGSPAGEIKNQLQLSTNTVKTHLRRVYQKLDVSCHAELERVVKSLEPP